MNINMGGNNYQYEQLNVPTEKLDLFIDRCKDEKGYSLAILGNEIQVYLQQGMFNLDHFDTYQKILLRIKQRYDKGEK